MALTWTQCKNATNNSGNNPGLSLFDRGYNGAISGARDSDHIEFMVYWSVYGYDSSAETYTCTVYLFARKTDGYSSQNDFTITYHYAGNSYTTTVNRTINSSSGKVRFMGSHVFEGLTTDRTSNAGQCYVQIKGASGSTLDGTYKLSKTIKFSASQHEKSISSRTTTSINYRLGNLVTNRNFRTYLRWGKKKSTQTNYSNNVSDSTEIGPESTTTAFIKKFDGLTPCTLYDLRVYLGMYNYNPDTEEYNYAVIFDQKYWKMSAYTNAKVITGPTTHTDRVYNGEEQTGVSGGTGFTYGGTRAATNVGSYTATATPMAQYNWTSTGMAQSSKEVREYTWKITPKPFTVENISVTLSANSFVYTGSAIEPAVTVRDIARNVVLTEGADYRLRYVSNVNANDGAFVEITGLVNYSGTISADFKVTPKPVSGLALTIGTTSYVYDGGVKTPSVTVKDNERGVTLTDGTDYTVVYSNNINVGTATLKITGKGNYTGEKSTTFKITPKSISGSDISIALSPSSFVYSGSANKPTATVKDTSRNVTLGVSVEYSISYSNNTNAGTGTITISGVGNYNGSKNATFKIAAKPFTNDVKITVSPTSYTYDGKTKTPSVTVEDTVRKISLVSGADYTVTYSNNINAGTATITVTSKGNYTGSKNAAFTISKAVSNLTVSPTAFTIKRKKTATATFSRAGNGSVSVKSNNTGVATATISGSNITITGVKKGSCTITVTCAEAVNYNGSSKIIAVTVENGVCVRYEGHECGSIFYDGKEIVAIFYEDREIL